jgi:hypothetical protein
MRPVQFIYDRFVSMVHAGKGSAEIVKHLHSKRFEQELKKEYKYINPTEELLKMFYEAKTYGKVLRDTPFRCVYGEDGSLQYYHMCQECGNILHDPHDSQYVADHDMMCPTCNGIDVEKYPYKTIVRGTMHWIHLVRSAESTDRFHEENPEHAGYISGSAKDLAFRVTRLMAFKWWTFVQWSRIKAIANNIRHPKQYIEKIKARNEWRKKMEAI